MKCLFSIVIANYNYGRFLDEAIQSVLSQVGDGKDQVRPGEVELIVIDGGSTDNSVDVIKKYAGGESRQGGVVALQNSKISYWVSEKDRGQSDAFNKGFAKATGRFLTWLNADDVFLPGALNAVAKEITRHPRCEWFVGSSFWADSMLKIEKCFCAHRFSSLRARYGFLTVAGPSSFFSRRLYEEAGKIDESLHFVMDTDLWYKFYFKCGARYRRTIHPVWCFRRHAESKMSGGDVCVSPQVLKNREKVKKEAAVLDGRYGRRTGFLYRIAHVLSFSVLDSIVARYYKLRYAGRILVKQHFA